MSEDVPTRLCGTSSLFPLTPIVNLTDFEVKLSYYRASLFAVPK